MINDLCYTKARADWRDGILEKVEKSGGERYFFDIYSTTPFVMPEGGRVEKTDAENGGLIFSAVSRERGRTVSANRETISLQMWKKQQLKDICSLYSHVVVAVNAGGPVDLSFMDEYDNIEALLQNLPAGNGGRTCLCGYPQRKDGSLGKADGYMGVQI